MSRRLFGAVAAVGAVLVSWVAVSQPMPPTVPAGARPARRGAPVFRAGITPASVDPAERFELRHGRASALFTSMGMAMRLSSPTRPARELGWRVAGGRAVKPQAEKPREAKFHRLVGARESWRTGLPTYGGLRYPGVLPGVELWFEERAEGVKYGFRAGRGADLKRVGLEYAGAREVRVVDGGRALEVDVGEGVLREEGLRCEQQGADGAMREVGCWFTGARPLGQDRWAYAIEVAVEDPERPVVVDPVILWNTYLGGPGAFDELQDIQQDSTTGELFVVGSTQAAPVSEPGTGTRIGQGAAGTDVLVARFRADGGLVWWTLFGGDDSDLGQALVIGETGELYIAGTTLSPHFIWTRPDGTEWISTTHSTSLEDGFVAKLDSATGTKLDWFYRLAGNGEDELNMMIPGPEGRLFLAGKTTSSNLEGAGPMTPDGVEGFITRFDTRTPRVEWTLPLVVQGDQSVSNLVYTDGGTLYATGSTSLFSGLNTDAFAMRITGADGLQPALSSCAVFGGSESELGIAVSVLPAGAEGEVVVWGTTYSRQFEGAGVQGRSDIFAAVIQRTSDGGLSLRRSLLFGGTGEDELLSFTTDSSNRLYLGGYTTSRGLPLDGGFDTALEDNGLGDGFVARVNLGQELAVEWGSFVGGSGADAVYALRVDQQNPERLYIGGATDSRVLMSSGTGFDTSHNAPGLNPFLMAADMAASPPEPPPGPAPDPLSPLGWSCGANVTSGGPGALALCTLAGLALLVSRRRPRA